MAYKGKSLDVLKKSDPGGFKARIAHLIATGNSAAVPTKYLPAGAGKILQQRNLKARLDAPVTPGSSLTNRDLAHEAQQAVTTQYQPQEQAQTQQAGIITNQRANLPGYYQNYLGVLKGAQTQAGADAARTGANIQALGESAQKAATSQDTSVLAKLQQDSQRLGVQMDPSVTANAANAASSSRSVADAQSGTAALMGLAQQGLLRMTEAGAGLAQQEGIGKLNAQQSQLAQQNTALKREEGLANQAYRTKRRSDEVTSVATSALAGVKATAADTAAQVAKKNATSQRISAEASRTRAQNAAKPKPVADAPFKYGYTKKEWLALPLSERRKIDTQHASKKKPGSQADATTGPGSISSSAEQKYVSQINRAAGYLHDGKIPIKDQNGNPTLRAAKNRGEVIAWLKAQGIDPRALAVANSLAANNLQGIGGHGVKNAHDLGVHVGGRWKVVNGAPQSKPKRRVPSRTGGPAGTIGPPKS